MSEELRVLDRLENGLAADAITNVWTTVTGWFDAKVWGATLIFLLLLIGGAYLLVVSRRTRT